MRDSRIFDDEPPVDDISDELAQRQFDANWRDWCAGGPKDGGYTRQGAGIALTPPRLTVKRLATLRPTDLMAKNAREFSLWHVAFLQAYLAGQKLTETAYFQEYLRARLSKQESSDRAGKFIELFEDVRQNGVRLPARVADVSRVVHFPFFRFDGAHRTACAHVLGVKSVSAIVYATTGGEAGPLTRWIRGRSVR